MRQSRTGKTSGAAQCVAPFLLRKGFWDKGSAMRAALVVVGAAMLALAGGHGAMADSRVADAKGPALIAAAERGDVPAVTRLIGAGVALDTRDERGRTALLVATQVNQIGVALVLVSAGADVNAKDNIEDSPFLYAGAEGRNEILRILIEADADLASTNRYGGTALIPAAHHGHVETVKILLATPINIDHVNRLGWTALLETVILGDGGPVHTEILRLLIEAGANVNLADREGVTPLAHARKRNYSAMIEALERAGAR